jgi:Zn-dependent protease with chaperone function
MDFFEHQEQAKAASKRLLFLFLALTFVVVLGVDFVIYLTIQLFENKEAMINPVDRMSREGALNVYAPVGIVARASLSGFINWQLSLQGLAAASVSVFILSFGCFMRWLDLRKGGGGLAVNIGARSLGFASKEDKEQQLLNVVAEMAIAAGITAPSVYVLDHETSINAFVVGYELEDTVMVVTRGLLNSMNRDELQAVVGHEFSHILHGDNRVNIHLMIMIAGFAWVAEIGHSLTSRHSYGRTGMGYRRRSYHSSSKSSQQAASIGIPLIIIGFIGTLCGRLIRTSISRKREYLADASSVQFTRNPDALASALNVIRTNSHQGLLKNARAEELSHMCISPSRRSSWFASHPPLEDRINTIDDTFIKRFEARDRKADREEKRHAKKQEQVQTTRSMYSPDIAVMQMAGSGHLHDVVGTMSAANLDYAMSLHDEFPVEYRRALHSADHAKTMLLYLLLDTEPTLRKEQLEWLNQQLPKSQDYLHSLTLLSQGLQSRLALPLVELLIPLLKSLDADTQKSLLEQALIMAKWDGKLTLFEISLYSLLKTSFDDQAHKKTTHTIKDINLVAYEFNLIISSFIHSAGGSQSEKLNHYNNMINIFSLKSQTIISKDKINAKALYATLKKLKTLSPMLKRSLMDVCGDIVFHDGIVQGKEYESLKLMSLLLSCPMPAMPVSK